MSAKLIKFGYGRGNRSYGIQFFLVNQCYTMLVTQTFKTISPLLKPCKNEIKSNNIKENQTREAD